MTFSILQSTDLPFLFPVVAVFGFILGSFYTALADRILLYRYGKKRKKPHPWKELFFRPSYCVFCERRIHPLDLIPVFGFLIRRGRCRYCNHPIPVHLFVGEALPGILFVYLLTSGHALIESCFTVLFTGHLYLSIATDWKHRMLDYENSAILYLLASGALLSSSLDRDLILNFHVYPALGTAILFALLYLIGRGRKMGIGDVILAPAPALLLGIPALFLLIQIAASLSIVYILLVKKERRAAAPLGAFLAIATIVLLLFDAIRTTYWP